MDWSDRLVWLIVGAVLGYLIRLLQDIKKEVHEVDVIVKHDRDEAGIARFPVILNILIVSVFAMTVFSVVRVEMSYQKSDQAVADLQKQQKENEAQNDRIEAIATCTLSFTAQTIRALNERTQYTQAAANANARVLREQARFLRIVLIIPPVSDDESRAALEAYFERLRNFNRVSALQKQQVAQNPYPTNEELAECLQVEREKQETANE